MHKVRCAGTGVHVSRCVSFQNQGSEEEQREPRIVPSILPRICGEVEGEVEDEGIDRGQAPFFNWTFCSIIVEHHVTFIRCSRLIVAASTEATMYSSTRSINGDI